VTLLSFLVPPVQLPCLHLLPFPSSVLPRLCLIDGAAQYFDRLLLSGPSSPKGHPFYSVNSSSLGSVPQSRFYHILCWVIAPSLASEGLIPPPPLLSREAVVVSRLFPSFPTFHIGCSRKPRRLDVPLFALHLPQLIVDSIGFRCSLPTD